MASLSALRAGREASPPELGERSKPTLAALAGTIELFGGFLVAYEEEPSVYYNWIMGVIPSFRRQGVASCLMDAFESSARTRGYESVRVRSVNE